MANKSKLFFADNISYTDKSNFVDYKRIKIKSSDKLEGGLMKMILAYIYFFTLASGLIFLLGR